jgi:spore coat polysaccharide biosynthesis protein SpsF
MKNVAIIQARMGSTRFPGKVMKTLGELTVLGHVITRVKFCPLVDEVMVATTILPTDEVIVKKAKAHGASVFRGSEDDVLSRYYGAAKEAKADVIIRVTSDCPLFDPYVLEEMLQKFYQVKDSGQPLDYLSNTLGRTFPRGLDAEIFTFSALERAHFKAKLAMEREHVTPYIYRHPEIFFLKNFLCPEDLSFHRWTLDTQEDFDLIQEIFKALGKARTFFSTREILDLFAQRPELLAINANIRQKELGH